MLTTIQVNGKSYEGTLILEDRVRHQTGLAVPCHYGYLSAHRAKGRWVAVSRYAFDGKKVTEKELRGAVVAAIEARANRDDAFFDALELYEHYRAPDSKR